MAYLDHASTTPIHPAARAVLLAALADGWADPARLYSGGRRVRTMLDDARARVAASIGVRPDEVSFTASGTQSVHLGVLGGLAGRRRAGNQLVTTAVEHSSVLAAADLHEAGGGAVCRVGVDQQGQVAAADIAGAIRDDTGLVSVQHANHEVGTVQPVAEIATACAARGVPLHVDAGQTVGRIPVDFVALGASIVSASAHKWGGPAGVGILVVRKGVRWRSPLPTDEREGRRVAGYPNVPAIAAAAAALEARADEIDAENARLSAMVDRVRAEVPQLVADVEVVGDPVLRLPHIVTFSCLYVDGESLVTELDRRGIAVTSGSSCTSSTLQPSHVLEAMGVLTHGNVRVSFGRGSTDDDVDTLLRELPDVVASLRRAGTTERL